MNVMSSASPQKDRVRLFYDAVWNRGETARIAEICYEDFTFRGSLGPVLTGHDAFAGYVDRVRAALGDYRCAIEDMVEEESRVVARMTFSGVHRGEFLGFAPTGKRVSWAGSAHFTFSDDLVADLWVLGDVHGLLALLEANRLTELR